MNLDQIVTFLKVYQLGSFQEAADQLYLPQPTVSHRIHQLEKEFGKQLLFRGKGKVKLTEEGKAFLPYARSALAALEAGREAVGCVGDGVYGKLSIGCNNALVKCLLFDALDSFGLKHPQVTTKIYCYSAQELVRMMKRRLFQIGLTRYTSNDSDLTYLPIRSEPMRLLVAPEHPFAMRSRIPLEEMLREPLIVYHRDTEYRKVFDVVLNQLNVTYTVKYETNNLDLIKHLLKRNEAVHFSGPLYMTHEIEKNELVQVEIEHNPFPMSQVFLVFREAELNSLDRIFIRHLLDHLDIRDVMGKAM